MASTINGTSTGNGGLITTGDDSGILNIQTNETTAVSVDASQNLTFTNGINAPNTFGMKNRIINGNMTIDQRNAGASVTPTGSAYTLDRWYAVVSQSSKFSVQQNAGSVTPPAGYKYYLGVTSTSAYSVGSGDYFDINQRIEGFNTADLNWGTANAATVTLSFWVRSSLTGTFGGCLGNDGGSRSYPFTYTINAANTWEQKTITIAGDQSGTWNTTTSVGIQLIFSLGAGSTYSGAAGSWSSANYVSATGATSVVGTNGATFYITGVQLEKGTQATSFDFRSYGQELALCQRYYERFGGAGYTRFGVGICANSTTSYNFLQFAVQKRTAPSAGFSQGGSFQLWTPSSFSITALQISSSETSTSSTLIQANVASGLTAGVPSQIYAYADTSAYMAFSAEL